ncbi:MAG: hypothetical protein WC614_02020 [bacterium]
MTEKKKQQFTPLQIMGVFWTTFGIVVMITAYAPATRVGKITDLLSGGILLIIGIIALLKGKVKTCEK